jgi:predicted AAA+ superfamily ATPase
MVEAVFPRITVAPKGSFFLFGARGVGKSTWARETLPGAHRFDLLDEGLFQGFLADPALFGAELRTLEPGSWVVVDEVQRIPGLLNEVHRAIEELRLRFALLGSSARKLKTAGTNLLAGRALWRTMYPFVPQELGAAFDLESTLQFGSIPLVVASEDRAATLAAYVQLYLREEIRGEALVRNLPGFVRFLPIAALAHGQVVNVAGIARDSGTARTTVQGYLEILEDTLLAWRLAAFETRLRVRERKHPKLYWLDPGLVRAVKKQLGAVSAEEAGSLFEGWIHTLLRAYGDTGPLFDEIAYWSPAETRSVEVDFLLQRGGEHLALEVKAGTRFSPAWLSGLTAIGDLPRLARRVLVYTGTRELRTPEGIEVWPLAKLLTALAEGTLWP